jgi:hypothetical protein
LANKPRELLSNLLASLLVGRIESVANDSYFDAVYRQWETSTKIGRDESHWRGVTSVQTGPAMGGALVAE